MSNFPLLFGNEGTKAGLASDVRRGTLSHAIIIAGPRGSGKKTLLHSLVMALNCEAKDTAVDFPCGTCSACRRIREGNFTDFKILSLQSGKSTIGADELRDFKADMHLSASESAYKVYAIENAEAMTPAAQNALLKSLEEPPKNVHIVLMATEIGSLLSTIRSRARLIRTELFREEEFKAHLIRLSSSAAELAHRSPEKLHAIAVCAGGVIGKALSMLDEKSIAEAEASREAAVAIVEALPKRTPFAKLYAAISSLPTKRDELILILRELLSALRDIVAVHNSDSAGLLFYLSREDAESALGNMSVGRIIKVQNIILDALRDIDRNVVIPALLTDIAVRIREA